MCVLISVWGCYAKSYMYISKMWGQHTMDQCAAPYGIYSSTDMCTGVYVSVLVSACGTFGEASCDED